MTTTFLLALLGSLLGIGNLLFSIWRWRKERAGADLSLVLQPPGQRVYSLTELMDASIRGSDENLDPNPRVSALVRNDGKVPAHQLTIQLSHLYGETTFIESFEADSVPTVPPDGGTLEMHHDARDEFGDGQLTVRWREQGRRPRTLHGTFKRFDMESTVAVPVTLRQPVRILRVLLGNWIAGRGD